MRTLSDMQRAYDARSDDEPDELQEFLEYQLKQQDDSCARMRQSLKIIQAMAEGLIGLKAEPCLDDLQEILDEAKKGLGE